ncbi:MAG: hypothetical protein N4A43_02280 [Alphaproteobacteria bacterium]|jgi:hypothetical protein|nr:hypothetical protein [Alphaproteobacteria bacterium]
MQFNLKDIVSLINKALQFAVPFFLGQNLGANKAKDKSNELIKKTKKAINNANSDGSK